MKKIVIVIDNMRIGGVQRIALDEAYAFIEKGYKIHFVILENRRNDDDLISSDLKFFSEYSHSISISECEGNNREILRTLYFVLKDKEVRLIICHSAKALPMTYMLRALFFKKKKFRILGYMHQLITLSDTKQKIKRIVYFNFCDQLRASSKQFILELEHLFSLNFLFRVISFRKIMFDRMGIFIPRIDFYMNNNELEQSQVSKPAVMFLSRVVGWKGFETFLNICETLNESHEKIVFTPSIYRSAKGLERFTSFRDNRIILDSQVACLTNFDNCVHLYPTDYGRNVSFPQNIGMNVLECIALGIPSLISHEDFVTWPELKFSSLIETTDWEAESCIKQIEKLLSISSFTRAIEVQKLRPLISNMAHVNSIEEFAL